MTIPYEYAKTNGERFVEELKDWLRIPSISTLSDHASDVRRAAEWARDQCLAIGMNRAEIIETAGHPIVYAEWIGAEDAPTVLVYGHYDVQPVDDPRSEWLSPPFEPTERNGNLYCRGAVDDKGQAFIHLKAFEAIMKTRGSLPLNFKLFLEGEEECGSLNLPSFVQSHLELLDCDALVISDSHILSPTQPAIVCGLRGMIYTEIEVFGPATDLHSGAYGGAVHNPAQALAEILAKLHDEQGRVTVTGFYDHVRPLTPMDREALAAVPFDESEFLQRAGIPKAWGDPDYTIKERLGARPTLEINGLVGGWTGEGSKTVIGSRALAKVSCRLVPDQDPQHILDCLRDYVAKITPDTVRSEVRLLHSGGPGVVVPIDSRAMQAAAGAYEQVFGVKPYFVREGGSIPVVSMFQQSMGVPILLMGFGLPDDNLHAPNEKFTLEMFHKGVQTMLHFYETLPQAF